MQTAGEILAAKGGALISIQAESTIFEALTLMNEMRVGAIVVKEADAIVGIWTERDLMSNVMDDGFDMKTERIGKRMTRGLKYAEHDDTIYKLEDKFLGLKLRHLLVRKNGECIGILSTGDVVKAVLNNKKRELEQLNAMVGWEYYDNWRWDPNKKG